MTLETYPNYYTVNWGWRRHLLGVDIFTPSKVYLIRW